MRQGIALKASGQGGGGVLGGEVMEHIGGGDEARRGAVDNGVMDEVFGEHRFTGAVGANEYDVGGFGDKLTAQ